MTADPASWKSIFFLCILWQFWQQTGISFNFWQLITENFYFLTGDSRSWQLKTNLFPMYFWWQLTECDFILTVDYTHTHTHTARHRYTNTAWAKIYMLDIDQRTILQCLVFMHSYYVTPLTADNFYFLTADRNDFYFF